MTEIQLPLENLAGELEDSRLGIVAWFRTGDTDFHHNLTEEMEEAVKCFNGFP